MKDANVLKAVSANATRADVVAVGTVEIVGPAPNIWSGSLATYQEIQYDAVTYLKRKPSGPESLSIKVFHPVVAKSRTADEHTPMLRKDVFARGSRLVLFLRATPSRLETLDENYGAVEVDPDVLEAVNAALSQ